MATRDQEIGELKGILNALKNSFDEHKKDMKDSVDSIHKRINDHMDDEEDDRKTSLDIQNSYDKRLSSLEEFSKFIQWTLKWVMPLLLFLWPIIMPVLQRLFAEWLNVDVAQLSFLVKPFGSIKIL